MPGAGLKMRACLPQKQEAPGSVRFETVRADGNRTAAVPVPNPVPTGSGSNRFRFQPVPVHIGRGRGLWPWVVAVGRGRGPWPWVVAVAAPWPTVVLSVVMYVHGRSGPVPVPSRFRFNMLESKIGSGSSGSFFITGSAGSVPNRFRFPVPRVQFLGFLP